MMTMPQKIRKPSRQAADQKRLLLAGCGRLGRRLAKLAASNGWHVTALSRRAVSADGVHQSVAADLTVPESLAVLSHGFDAAVYSPTPDERDAEAYQRIFCSGLQNLLERRILSTDGRLIFVSSTAVYGQNDGSWINEDSPAEPINFNGKILLEGERLALSSGYRSTIVRLSGLYGNADNYLIRRLLAGNVNTKNLDHWTNRIHLQDAAGLIDLLLQSDSPNVINGVDDRPVLRIEMLRWLAEQLRQRYPSTELDACCVQLDRAHAAGEQQQTGKRISNQSSRNLGYKYLYPDYQCGYADILSSINKPT